MLSALLEQRTPETWTLFALLVVSGLFGAIALMRVGMRHFWTARDRPAAACARDRDAADRGPAGHPR